MDLTLLTPVKYIKGVGEKRAELFNKLGIVSVNDLLDYFPFRYNSWSDIKEISDCKNGETVCIKGVVGSTIYKKYIRPGMTIYSAEVTDGKSIMEVTFFNNPWISKSLIIGNEYFFRGKITVSADRYHYFLSSPEFYPLNELHYPFEPVYKQINGLNNNYIKKIIKLVLDNLSIEKDIIPSDILDENNLIGINEAYRYMHFPRDSIQLENGKKRFAFQELFVIRMGLLRLKNKNMQSHGIVIENDYSNEFSKLLSYELTTAQKRTIAESFRDMKSGKTMNRLVQGDVGSGKTAVAAALIYNVCKNGYQAALMAPTEVLAKQHYATISDLFKGTDIKIALLTGSTPSSEKTIIKAQLKDGNIDVIIGTHAVIQEDVIFNNLSLAITDEQHRFGVNQRKKLTLKGKNIHTLVMSATPIPRTLSLIIYGDLDISYLDELPLGRQKIDTYLITSDKRERAYSFVKKQLLNNKQGYVVCPLVGDSIDNDNFNELHSAVEIYNDLKNNYFKGFKIGLLYGKMKPDEKNLIMEKFSNNEINLLISTTVIEVGINVPNAVIMIVENAERFGLSQLHQLRGRVGRGSEKSTCILISDKIEGDTYQRLKLMTQTNNGFRIADEDLKLRGPGDFFGERQHGLPSFKLSTQMFTLQLIDEVNLAAEKLLSDNPLLIGAEYVELKEKVNSFFKKNVIMN